MKNNRGMSIIEILVAIAISSLMLPALIFSFISSRQGKIQQGQRVDGAFLAKEAYEAVRIVKQRDWNEFAVNGIYHPEISNNTWSLTENPETTDNSFLRAIEISDAYRDENGNITQSGGNPDPSTKKVEITVSWTNPYPGAITDTSYFSRYINNSYFTHTTQEDFIEGTQNSVIVANYDGGEVMLGSGGSGSWCDPLLTVSTFDLPKNGVANDITAIEGLIFAGTGDNASGESYAKINISNASPPVASLIGTFSNYKTNAVFGEENYGYIATDTNSKEIVILNIASVPYTEIGYFNSPGNTDANSIYVSGNTGYMTAGNKFYNFDLSSKSGERQLIDPDGITLAGTGMRIKVVDNYAYVAVAGSTVELQIISLSNPTSLSIIGQADVNSHAAKSLYINNSATRAYIVTDQSADQREFYVVDINTKTGDRPTLGSYDTNGMTPKGVRVVPGNIAIIVGNSAEEYQVVNITNETNPRRCGSINVDTGVNGLDSVLESDGNAFSYIITGDSTSELKIIEGGPGGVFAYEGIYESASFDAGTNVAFNRFIASFDEPNMTDIKFQFAISDAVNDSCVNASFNFVGPDGTQSTYYEADSSIYLNDDDSAYENPGRCLKYRAYFSTQEITYTPILYDLSVNYSP